MKGELPSLYLSPLMELGMPCVAYLHSLLSWAIAVDMPCTSSNDSRFQDMHTRICALLCCAVLNSIRHPLWQLLPVQK